MENKILKTRGPPKYVTSGDQSHNYKLGHLMKKICHLLRQRSIILYYMLPLFVLT